MLVSSLLLLSSAAVTVTVTAALTFTVTVTVTLLLPLCYCCYCIITVTVINRQPSGQLCYVHKGRSPRDLALENNTQEATELRRLLLPPTALVGSATTSSEQGALSFRLLDRHALDQLRSGADAASLSVSLSRIPSSKGPLVKHNTQHCGTTFGFGHLPFNLTLTHTPYHLYLLL